MGSATTATTTTTTNWGRNSAPSWLTILLSTLVMVCSPIFVIIVWNWCHRYGGNLLALLVGGLAFPKFNLESLFIYVEWVLFQAALYLYLPGKIAYGQQTPAGHILPYRINGLWAWIISNGAFLLGSIGFGLFEPSIIADNWGGLLVATNLYGLLLTGFVYLKAKLSPTHLDDCKKSGSWLYDFYMGIEFNPRLGEWFDFKLFYNGRPGIVAWTMINMSFAAAQYRRFGQISDSMILVNILQALYVVDFFVHEDWYLKTMDIAHDHFGFMLAWGDSVWLPFMYTLQTQYLSYHPVYLGTGQFWIILTIGLMGYIIFREANFQKDVCRRTEGKCQIWGRPARTLYTIYQSSDGKLHKSLLLMSGFWGMARHCNYLGDLILSTAMCASCGLDSLLPYFYAIFMAILLTHRIERDHARCLGKYGKYWQEYCKVVPYKLVPFVY